MEEEDKTLLSEVASGSYDAADRPFDFVEMGSKTALVCEMDPTLRQKIGEAMNSLYYQVTEATTARDALKSMRFHIYDVIIVDDGFDQSQSGVNDVLRYLENLNMATRRQIFVVLLSDRYRTMDNMAAFNRSVNITVNLKNLDEIGQIITQGKADNDYFYHTFKETLKKVGRA
jgi:CheY-like chemotaxis protein